MRHWQQISIAIDVGVDDGERGMEFRDNFFNLLISIGYLLIGNVLVCVAQDQSASYRILISTASQANLPGENMPIQPSSMRAIMSLFTATTAAALALTPATAHASACDTSQQIRLSVGDRQIDRWTGASNSVRHIVLPNGFKLGVKIEQASQARV